MKIEVGKLKPGIKFITTLTEKRGLLIENERDKDGVWVELHKGSKVERKFIHKGAVVEVL